MPHSRQTDRPGPRAHPRKHPRLHARTHTPLRALSVKGHRYYNPGLGRWINRDPVEERGGLNVYLFVRNSAVFAIDGLGLRCRYVVLFGHGSDLAQQENWLLQQSQAWLGNLDECDMFATYGCKTAQVRELVLDELADDPSLSLDERLAIMTKLATIANETIWTADVDEQNAIGLWNTRVATGKTQHQPFAPVPWLRLASGVWIIAW